MLGTLCVLKNIKNWGRVGALSTLFALSGCLEVDNDDSNVAEAVREQNQLIEEQNNSAPSVYLYGQVNNLGTNELAGAITIRMKVGPNWMDPINFENGQYQLSDLKPSSKFEMVVSSPTGAFLDRTVYGSTSYSSVENAYQEFPTIDVSPGVVREFSVTNSETDAAIGGLEFFGYSHLGNGNTYKQYKHLSVYDSTTGLYSITLPEHINVELRADLDIDGDDEHNYNDLDIGYLSGTVWVFNSSYLESNTSFNLTDNANSIQEVTLRIAVLDEAANAVPGVELYIDDALNEELKPTYDDANGQYVFNAKVKGSVKVFIGAFESSEGTYYGSSLITLYEAEEENTFLVSASGTSSDQSYSVFDESLDFNIAVAPYTSEPQARLELVYKTEEIDFSNLTAKFFYSNAIEFEDQNVLLSKTQHLQVIRGNESDSDLVLPGTTYIEKIDLEIPTTKETSLGGTLLTVESVVELEEDTSYAYVVNSIKDVASDIDVNLTADRIEFKTPVTSTFSITDLRLDNNNYRANGSLIHSVNTAGEASSESWNSWDTFVFMPVSVKSLKNFSLYKKIVTTDGVKENDTHVYNIVEDGRFFRSNTSYTISLAHNENTDIQSGSGFYYGTSLPDSRWYVLSVEGRMNDNTPSSANLITFEYVYETQEGEVSTGEITLQVQ